MVNKKRKIIIYSLIIIAGMVLVVVAVKYGFALGRVFGEFLYNKSH